MHRLIRAGLGLALAGLLAACDSGAVATATVALPTLASTGTATAPLTTAEIALPTPLTALPTVAETALPTAAETALPTAVETALPTATEEISATATGAMATETPAAIVAPSTATTGAAAPAGEAKTALRLQPVKIQTTAATATGLFADGQTLNLPPGFAVNLYAAGVSGVRWLGLGPGGLLYATAPGAGKVYTLPDANGDGVADAVQTFADGLPGVHGIAFRDGVVYVATESQIIRLSDSNGDGTADKRTVLASDLPSGGGHSTRTLLFQPDGSLLVAAGSSCNVCKETNAKRAAVSLYSADGTFQRIFAAGLRNAVGLIAQPGSNTIWASVNGRDGLGDNTPPETIYQVQAGQNYGWPYCYGQRIPDTTQSPPAGYCAQTGVPAVEMQAHSAPLGLAFYDGKQFPAQFAGDLFVAFHGSWNRSVPTGYKLVRVRFVNGQPDSRAGNALVEDFATGWNRNGAVWGRPVEPLVAPDGALLLTDDKAGAIYRITYAP